MSPDEDVRRTREQIERDSRMNEAARREVLRRDGERSLGENLEQADSLISAAFKLRDALSQSRE